jgi:hypothetical protein
MYKLQSNQLTLTSFNMPLGLTINIDNRWVQKAHSTPWDEYEKRYAHIFKGSTTGNVAKPARLMIGALIIKSERNISDEEVVRQIQESHYLQYFCGMLEYIDEPPFEASTLTRFRGRLTDEMLMEIIELAIPKPDKPDKEYDQVSEEAEPSNKGDLLIDATCAPQNIRFPQDISILNEAREKLEQMIDIMHDRSDGKKPRTRRRIARKEYLTISKDKKKTAKKLRKAIKKQLKYIKDDMAFIENYFNKGRNLPLRLLGLYGTIRKVYEQQKFLNENKTHQIKDRIVSLSQPWVRPIARNKAGAKYEFGAKLTISVIDGYVRIVRSSFDPYNECTTFISAIEKYKEMYGYYPERVLGDQIFRNQANIKYCNDRKIKILGKPLGRPRKDEVRDKKAERKCEIDRIEVERKISLAKRSYSLARVWSKLQSTSKTSIAMSILAMNLAYKTRLIFVLIYKVLKNTKKSLKMVKDTLCEEIVFCVVQK